MKLLIVTDNLVSIGGGPAEPLPFSHLSLLRNIAKYHGVRIEDAPIVVLFPDNTGNYNELLVSKGDSLHGYGPLAKSKYLAATHAHYLRNLHERVAHEKPTVILTLGPMATWAFLRTASIRDVRGTTHPWRHGDRVFKIFPIYHPRAIFAEWELRAVLFADMQKLAVELTFPEIRRPAREIWIEPAYGDLVRFEEEHILPAKQLSIDIETAGTLITCIGFAPRSDLALVVPFVTSKGLYWKSLDEEVHVWKWVRRICALDKQIVGQNFLYDAHHLWRNYGIPVPHAAEDTMLLHHALQPELKKGLGFLASLYTSEARWKFMAKVKTTKKEN